MNGFLLGDITRKTDEESNYLCLVCSSKADKQANKATFTTNALKMNGNARKHIVFVPTVFVVVKRNLVAFSPNTLKAILNSNLPFIDFSCECGWKGNSESLYHKQRSQSH